MQPSHPTPVKYRPGSYYYRRAIRNIQDCEQIRLIAFMLVREHEELRAWVRDQGLIPPKFTVLAEEARDKGWN